MKQIEKETTMVKSVDLMFAGVIIVASMAFELIVLKFAPGATPIEKAMIPTPGVLTTLILGAIATHIRMWFFERLDHRRRR